METDARKLGELQSAFYEAWGYWEGHWISAGSVPMDASQVGRQFEALIRLECQLRLNGHSKEANNLGFTARTDFNDIRNQIGAVGVSLGLTQNEYRQWKAVGTDPKWSAKTGKGTSSLLPVVRALYCCHPERSEFIRFANELAQSKDLLFACGTTNV